MSDDLDLPQLALDLRLACQRISRGVRFEGTAEIAPHQASVLFRLDEPRSPGELAECERVSAPSMTRTVATLVEAGLVERAPHPTDGRQVVLTRTAAGDAILERTRQQRDSWMLAHLEGLDGSDLEVLRRAATILLDVTGR